MGLRETVARSTLADANEARDWRIWHELAQLLIRRARRFYPAESLAVDLDNSVHALDWTTIDLCLSMFPWAHFRFPWVDGIHFGVRIEEANQCIPVVMGATADGKKELVALTDGFRESEQSWKDVLLDMKRRGLKHDPQLAIGDGALGFWKALPQAFGTTTRCSLSTTSRRCTGSTCAPPTRSNRPSPPSVYARSSLVAADRARASCRRCSNSHKARSSGGRNCAAPR